MHNYPIVYQTEDEIHFNITEKWTTLAHVPELFTIPFFEFLNLKKSQSIKLDVTNREFDSNEKDLTILKILLKENSAYIDTLFWIEPKSNIIEILENKYETIQVGQNLLFNHMEKYKVLISKYNQIHKTFSNDLDFLHIKGPNNASIFYYLKDMNFTKIEHINFVYDKIFYDVFESIKSINVHDDKLFINFLNDITNNDLDLETFNDVNIFVKYMVKSGKYHIIYENVFELWNSNHNSRLHVSLYKDDIHFAHFTLAKNEYLFSNLYYLMKGCSFNSNFGDIKSKILDFIV